jgi:alpha-amylase
MLRLLAQLAAAHPQFTFSLSCSGVFLEQAQRWQPEIINLIADLVSKHQVELLAETYYHSLSFLYSETEFIYQINKHISKIEELFAVTPSVFRNTELIYSNHIAWLLAEHGLQFKGILTEAVDRYLAGRPRTQLFATPDFQYPLLLKHAPLSDDIAFRFSNPHWQGYPLTAETYLDWLQIYPEHEIVNLFMDFETFGEHQWQDTGIFDFFADFVQRFLKQDWNQFVTPSQAFAPYWQQAHSENGGNEDHGASIQPQVNSRLKPSLTLSENGRGPNRCQQSVQSQAHTHLNQLPVYDVPDYISWADLDRDLTAWVGNQLQADALRAVYELEPAVLDSRDRKLQEAWRRLQTSDHFYYMCTKWSADGDVHAYFSPYDSPLEAYRRYSIVLADLEQRLR